MDERLGISENKAMKLLITTFFTLLLIGFAGGSYGQEIRAVNYDDSIYVGELEKERVICPYCVA